MQSFQNQGAVRSLRTQLQSYASLVPLLLMLCWVTDAFVPNLQIKSALVSRDLEFQLESGGSGSALWIQLMLPAFTLVCLLWVGQSKETLSRYVRVLLPMLVVVVLLLASYFWSDHPGDTLRRAARQILLFTSIAGIVVISRTRSQYISQLQLISVFLLFYELLFLFIPYISFDLSGNFTGLHPNKNELGAVAGAFLLIAVCTWRYYAETPRERWIALFSALGWGFLLVISGSKTPMGFVVLLIPLAVLSVSFLRWVSIGLIVCWMLIIAAFPIFLIGMGEAPIEYYRSMLPEDALTGRTGIWFHLLSDIQKSWLLGTGYGAYWGVGQVPEAMDIKWSYYQFLQTAHSGFVDLVLQFGTALTVFSLAALWFFLLRTKDSADPLSMSFIAYAMLHNCLETSFLHGMHFVWIIMLLGILNISYTHASKHGYNVGSNGNNVAFPILQSSLRLVGSADKS